MDNFFVLPAMFTSMPMASEGCLPLRDCLLRESSKAQSTKAVCESTGWPGTEPGYGNNLCDWAIRMVTS